MGVGIMELDHTSFEWTLTYDEYDMVIDGILQIEIDGRGYDRQPGIFCTSQKAVIFIFNANLCAVRLFCIPGGFGKQWIEEQFL